MKNVKKASVFAVSLALVFSVAVSVNAKNENSEDNPSVAKRELAALQAEDHRNAVADVVLELKEVAGKDENIGEEVREVAKAQEDSSNDSADAIEKVENRNGFVTFLFGTDYKNIGILRSEIVTTENSIDRLTKARNRATSAEVKIDLDVQIEALQAEKAELENFVETNEDKFSILGWLVKLLN